MPRMLDLSRLSLGKGNFVGLVFEVVDSQCQKEGGDRKNQQKHSEENEHKRCVHLAAGKCNIFVTNK